MSKTIAVATAVNTKAPRSVLLSHGDGQNGEVCLCVFRGGAYETKNSDGVTEKHSSPVLKSPSGRKTTIEGRFYSVLFLKQRHLTKLSRQRQHSSSIYRQIYTNG